VIQDQDRHIYEEKRHMASQHNVFMSHSHKDREIAAEIDSVIRANGADTYLDQRQIEVGDHLPSNLNKGIEDCSLFLLIWSVAARKSIWVGKEWDLAYNKRKRIVSFVLDETPLPSPLDNFVHVDSQDRKLAYSTLLTTVFGKEFRPKAGAIFAGAWEAQCSLPSGVPNAFGMQGKYKLELRLNGQIVGTGMVSVDGPLGQMVAGLVGLYNQMLPLSGSWRYEFRTLELNLTTEFFGRRNTDTIHIVANEHETDLIQGRDLAGRTWTLRRVSSAL
jgi:hypothetical protein